MKPPRFDANWQAARRRRAAWRRWRWVLVLALVLGAWAALRWWAGAEPEGEWVRVERAFSLCGSSGGQAQTTPACVVDGDTLWIAPASRGEPPRRIRLTGFDAPELDGACERERAAAQAARGALFEWLSQGPFEWSGGADPPRDRYGRELRAARRTAPGGSTSQLARHMREAELAVGMGWDAAPGDWCDSAA